MVTDTAIGLSERHDLRSPYLGAAAHLDAARRWAKEVRSFLRPHGQTPAARELRDLLSGGKHHVAGTAAELRTAVVRMRDHADVLGDGLRDLAARGQVVLDDLSRCQADHDTWEEQRARLTAEAATHTHTLRDTIRSIRTHWRLVRVRTGGQMPELPMNLARSLTTRRTSAVPTEGEGGRPTPMAIGSGSAPGEGVDVSAKTMET